MGKIELQTPTSLPLVANEGQAEKMDYSGPFLYENNVLKCIFTSAGRILTFTNDGDVLYKFEYNLQDHLGNTRVVFGGHSSGKTELIQRTDYYPFGLVMAQQEYIAYEELPGHEVLKNKYLYNGKEWQDDEIGGVKLDWYDYGARMYDPELGRWHTVDPMAESMYSWSPYNYSFNNPIRFTDPNGTIPGDFFDDELTYLGTDGIVDGKKYVVTNSGDAQKIINNNQNNVNTRASDLNATPVTLASDNVINAMENAYNASNRPSEGDPTGGFHEEGGTYGTDGQGNPKVVPAKPGAGNTEMIQGGDVSIKTFTPANPSDVTSDYVIEGAYHVHPGGTKEVSTPDGSRGIASFIQRPTDNDLTKARNHATNGTSYTNGRTVTGNSYVIGAGNDMSKGGGRVYIYNSIGNLTNLPRDKFFNLAR